MNGWEPREFTQYNYDGDRLVSSVTYREPEFSRFDVDRALAHEILEADMGPYGVPLSEAMDPGNQFAFDAAGPAVNWAAKAVEDRKDSFYEANKDASRNGHVWSVKRKSVPAKQEPDGADG